MKRKDLDIQWAKAVKERARYRCEIEGCNRAGMHAHHVIKRRYKSERWNIDNGVCLCFEHHQDAETHPTKYKSIMQEIKEKRKSTVKFPYEVY